ncbi:MULTISPECIES: family 16 glycoside hydrolase [unclassified Micromonospora]|uniref:family 16 glycoside hydrolase n=1 Tax=unclassified Micromonospora TaxID=2617518 RepID=UPI002FEF3883
MGTRLLRRFRSPVLAALTLTLAATGLWATPAGAAPEQEPGVTLRVFDVQVPLNEICTLKPGQTPNVDKLMPTINWTSTTDFGFDQYFVSQVLGNVNISQAGSYTFRLTSDDGSKLTIDDTVVVNHDGLHGPTAKEGSVTLTAGLHPLRIDHFERDGGQQITLEWKTPGSSSFVVVPNSALSTDAGVVRVTAPGKKECEGVTDSPGDGLPLNAVHPGYTLTNLRPSGFQPQVTGMDWLPDDRLVITTWGGSDQTNGEVYILDNTGGSTGPGSVTTKKIAGGLKEPMGLKVVDGVVYVSEKQRLTKLVDTNGDEVADRLDTVATWPFGGNFHEFAFGLLYDEGFFYLNLSVSINYGGATTDPQPAANRGTTIKVNKDTGAVSYVAGGLRTPHGIGWGPEGGIFVTDNQGGWLPSSKLVHVKQGRFFNHYMNPAGPFDANPVTAPVLWMPQNEIANSPSTPLYLKSGRYAGQFVIGDVTYGGLQRAYVEKVNGEYQGALFRLTQGLEAGVTEVNLGPDGAIYVGGLGSGGNWGQEGKLTYGLQKLTPNSTNTFEMLAMRATAGGFEVEYTQPVSADTAANLASHYKAKQWRYVPTAGYGGPKVDEETLSVTSATLSADRKKVTLAVDGLKTGRVVYLRSPRPFTSDSGQSLWSTEAWYTLNAIPGGGTPPPTGGGNLALNKPATADSSCATTEGPAKAVNGSVSGGNSDKWCSTGTSKYLQVDLGSAQDVNRFVVKHAGAGGENVAWNTKDFTIATSTDGSNWTTRTTVTGNTASTTTHDVTTHSARYVRLAITAPTNTTDQAARIYELEAYGPAGGGSGTITGVGGKCLDVSNAATADGTKIQLWTCNGTNAQKWSRVGDTLRALDKCLDVSNGGTANGTKVQLWTCNGSGAQVWQPQTNGSILNPQSGKVLDAAGGSTAGGTQVQIWAYSGGDNQHWSINSGGSGRITLFDGDDLDAWQSTGGGAATWPVANGSMEAVGGDIRTKQNFGDFQLHVEWYEPTYPPDVTGQARGNSGIYLQDRYEIQVLDSYGDTSLDNTEAGSIYSRKAADSNAATAPETWQTYDITFRAARFDGSGNKTEDARVSVRWNGTLVHDNVAISSPTGGGAAETAARGPVRLQDHGDPGANVRYRNIWIEPLN